QIELVVGRRARDRRRAKPHARAQHDRSLQEVTAMDAAFHGGPRANDRGRWWKNVIVTTSEHDCDYFSCNILDSDTFVVFGRLPLRAVNDAANLNRTWRHSARRKFHVSNWSIRCAPSRLRVSFLREDF